MVGRISPYSFILLLFLTASSFAKEVVPTLKCEPDQHYVRAHFRRAYVKTNGTRVSASNVSAHCADNPKGYSFWFPKIKKGLPNSWPHKERAAVLSEGEREATIEALVALPSELWSGRITGIYRARRSVAYPNPASYSDGEIVLYDTAFESSKNLSEILAHELAHAEYDSIKQEGRQEYENAALWYRSIPPHSEYLRRPTDYVEEDGKMSPSEDFANNLQYYLFHPEKLKRTNPNIFDWIKKRYGDKFSLGKNRK